MNWKRIFTSPPPSTGWLLDRSFAAVMWREPKGAFGCSAVEVDEEVLEVGPVGLQSVDVDGLRAALGPLQEGANGSRRVAVVVPTAWVRAHLLDFDHLPRRRAEIDDVVRWRLKKLLPVQPTQLRLALHETSAPDGRRRLLCTAGLDKAFADLEAAFAAVGVEPGLMTPRLFALTASEAGPHPRVIVQQEQGFLSIAVVGEQGPLLLRTKPLAEPAGPWQVVVREQHLALTYLREQLDVHQPLTALISSQSPELDDGLRQWWADQADVSVDAPPVPPGQAGPAEQLGSADLEPLLGVLGVRSR